MIIGVLSSALLVDAGGLAPSTVALLELIPLTAICAWILLTGQLAAPMGSRRTRKTPLTRT